MVCDFYPSSEEEETRWLSGACWPRKLVSLTRSRPVREPVSEKPCREAEEKENSAVKSSYTTLPKELGLVSSTHFGLLTILRISACYES